MATKVDETVNGKNIRPKSSTASSPQGETSIATPKSKPNYLKPTISSSGIEARNNVKKQPAKAQVVSTRPARAAMERHPSSFKHPQKAPSPISTKEKPLLRSRSANQRTTTPISPKAASDAATKSARGGKPQTPTKQWVLKKQATSHVNAPAAATASDSTTTDNDNLSPKSDQQGRPDHLMDVEGSEKGDQDDSEEHEPTREPTEEVKVEPEIKDVGEVIQNTTDHDDTKKEQVDETHETGYAMQEPKESPTSEVIEEEIPQGNKQEKPIDDEKILGTAGSSEEVAPAPDKSDVEKADVEGEESRGNAKDEVEVPELKPEPEKEVVKQKPKPENEVVRKAAVRGKKDAPVYNEVIEETVSKLAEKRKNRVLALAGAFETVISLHEAEAQAPKDRD